MESLVGKLHRCSINTATLGHRDPLPVVVDQIAQAGFGGIAPWRREVEESHIPTLARQIREAGLKVTGYCRSTYIPAINRATFRANIEDNKKALHDAASLNAACFVMVVGGVPEGTTDINGAREQLAEGIAELLPVARSVGVPMALEPLHPVYAANRSVLNTISQAMALCNLVDPSNSGSLGIAIDVYHCWWDPDFFKSTMCAGQANRILAYHVCDWLYGTQDVLLDRGMMGDGVIDLRNMRHAVEDAGYTGLIEVEIFSKNNWWKRDVSEVLSICAERLESVC